MNITAIITDKKADIAAFEPADGTFDLDALSSEMEEVSTCDVEAQIAADLEPKLGFAVTVQIFHANGHAITSETPSAGNFLVTRKWK